MSPERKAYETRVKLPGWNIRPSLGFEMDTATRRRIIRRLLPSMTAEQYLERASYHAGREMIARDTEEAERKGRAVLLDANKPVDGHTAEAFVSVTDEWN